MPIHHGVSSARTLDAPATGVRRRPGAHLRGAAASGLAWLPSGRTLPDFDWARRHRWVVLLLLAHALVLPVLAASRGFDVRYVVVEGLGVACLAGVAAWDRLPRGIRSATAALGLVICSSILVHVYGGAIEAHFHFFVMVPIVAMYEDWVPFGLAVAYVLFEHGVVGTIVPRAVYSHGSAHDDPWVWAAVHAGFFAAACIGALVNWRFAEDGRRELTSVATAFDHQARHDQLTGLANRVHLTAAGRTVVDAARRAGRPLSLLMIDLDRFKEVNDTLGHSWGDELLVQVASRLAAATRPTDVLVRLGGDEFALLLPATDEQTAAVAAARLQGTLRSPFDVAGVALDVEASVGVATWSVDDQPQPDDVLADLLRRADIAMYAAKSSNAGVMSYTPSSDVGTLDRLTLLTELRRGIARGELEMHYQPKVDLGTGRVVGAEALVRWRHPERGLLPPAAFIDVAEPTSLMRLITDTVLDLAVADAVAWREAGAPIQVAVNVSASSMHGEQFVPSVLACLDRHGLPPELLRLELTETVIMADAEAAGAMLTELADRGVGVSIDDFGTGYSSMSYLRALPVDELKVDRSFVLGLARPHDTSTGDDLAIVTSAIQLAHSLGMTVVAEGIETAEVQDLLGRLGCDTAQGYHLARPMPAEQLSAWLGAVVAPSLSAGRV